MKIIKSKPKKERAAYDIFFCRKCGRTYNVTFDIDRNKYFCSVHDEEEAIKFSSSDFLGINSWYMLFIMAVMYPEALRFDNNKYVCPNCGELPGYDVDAGCEIGNETCKRCGRRVSTIIKEENLWK